MNFDKLKGIEGLHLILDIGAHTGSFSTRIHELYPEARIVMFEANPHCRAYLENLPFESHLVGLWSNWGSEVLYMPPNDPLCTGNSIFCETTDHFAKAEGKLIDVLPLDSFELQPDLIKLDTQGSELKIINGGVETIRHAKWLIVEVSLAPYNEGAPLMNEVVDRLFLLGFIIEDILEYHSSPHHYDGCIFQLDLLFKRK